MDVELRHLRSFATVARLGSISAASGILHIAQPALSRQISELEVELRAKLFVRRARGVTLTDAGAAFLEDAQAILRSLREASKRCAAVARGEAGTLRLGFVGTAAHYRFLSEGIRDFRERYPDVVLELRRLRSEANLAALRAGELDVAICYHRSDDDAKLEGLLVEEDRYLLAVPIHHHLANVGVTTLSEIAAERFLWYSRALGEMTYDQIAEAFAAQGLSLNVVQEGESEETLLELVSVGMGCTFVISSVRKRREMANVALMPIADLDVVLSLQVVWPRKPRRLVESFMQLITPLVAAERKRAATD
jgi:DNA-binding transcriptional LysR family regulator